MSSTSYGYGCIIDAGSSGSRIYLYRWQKGKEDDELFTKVYQKALHSDERSIGISSEGGVDMLDELLSSAKDALPSNVDLHDVPIYLGATAGMRLLDEVEADAIMSNIRSILHTSRFMFRDDWARIISRDEESVFGWLVANYLRGNGNLGLSTYGALDLGGGSTQISLSVPTTLAAKRNDVYPLHIGNLNYPLYTQSYLNYGADQARKRYEEKFVPTSKVNPCYATGYTSDTGVSGSSNWVECLENVAKLFEQRSNFNLRGTGQDDIVISPPIGDTQQQRYIAMSVFVFVWDFLGLKTGAETDDLETLKERAEQICNNFDYTHQKLQYDQQMKDKPPGRKTNKPYAQCFNAAFPYHLLSTGYKMPVKDTPIEVYYDINGSKVDWSLGMMLVEANKLNQDHNKSLGLKYTSSMGKAAHSYLFITLVVLLSLTLGSLMKSRRVASSRFRKGTSFQRTYSLQVSNI